MDADRAFARLEDAMFAVTEERKDAKTVVGLLRLALEGDQSRLVCCHWKWSEP